MREHRDEKQEIALSRGLWTVEKVRSDDRERRESCEPTDHSARPALQR